MDISFKIFFEGKDRNVVALKSSFSKYIEYNKLRLDLIKASNKALFKENLLTQKDLFMIEFGEGIIIPNLKAIWNDSTYNYFLEKLQTFDPSIKVIKLYAHKTKEYPVWSPPKYAKILEKALDESWKSTANELSDELDTIKLNDAKIQFDLNKIQNDESKKKELLSKIHINVICNNCLSNNFCGARYSCTECDNYNLCQYCKENGRLDHSKEHTLIKIQKPILTDSNLFNNIFRPQKLFLKNQAKLFSADFEVVNNGETNLQGCFVLPIRYGKNYLECLKKTITDDFFPGEKQNVNIAIKINENNKEDEDANKDNKYQIYEGYFRMFTEEGLPFGEIFYVKVINEEQ